MDEELLLEKDFWDTLKTNAKSALDKVAYKAVSKIGGSNQRLSNSVIATDLVKRWNRYLAQRRAGHKNIEGNADDLAFFIKRYFGDDAYSDVEDLIYELNITDKQPIAQTPTNAAPVNNKSDENNPAVNDYDWHRNKNNTGWYRKLPFKNSGFDYLLDTDNNLTGEAWVKQNSTFSGKVAKNPPPPLQNNNQSTNQPVANTPSKPVVNAQPQPTNPGINIKSKVPYQKPKTTQTSQRTAPVYSTNAPSNSKPNQFGNRNIQPNTFGRKIDWTNPNAINSALGRANPEQKQKMVATIKNAIQKNPDLVDKFPALKAYESHKNNNTNMITEAELKTSQVYKVMQGLASYQLTNIRNRDEYGYNRSYRSGNYGTVRTNPMSRIVTINGWRYIMMDKKYNNRISDETKNQVEDILKKKGGASIEQIYKIVDDHTDLFDVLMHAANHKS